LNISWGLVTKSYFFIFAAAIKIAIGILTRKVKIVETDKNTKY